MGQPGSLLWEPLLPTPGPHVCCPYPSPGAGRPIRPVSARVSGGLCGTPAACTGRGSASLSTGGSVTTFPTLRLWPHGLDFPPRERFAFLPPPTCRRVPRLPGPEASGSWRAHCADCSGGHPSVAQPLCPRPHGRQARARSAPSPGGAVPPPPKPDPLTPAGNRPPPRSPSYLSTPYTYTTANISQKAMTSRGMEPA